MKERHEMGKKRKREKAREREMRREGGQRDRKVRDRERQRQSQRNCSKAYTFLFPQMTGCGCLIDRGSRNALA